MSVERFNRDDMEDGLKRADLRSGDDMVVLFQRPKRIEKDALSEDGASQHALLSTRFFAFLQCGCV